MATETLEDSQSEDTAVSGDEDADADDSDLSEVDGSEAVGLEKVRSKGTETERNDKQERAPDSAVSLAPRTDPAFPAMTDTEVMMNGMNIRDEGEEAIEFEAAPAVQESQKEETPVTMRDSSKPETLADRRRREHEEYRKKRDSDPAFIPTRGAFFMHDQRSGPPAQNGAASFPKGRGRGRPPVGGPFSPAKYVKSSRCQRLHADIHSLRAQTSEATSGPWAHDLHETVNLPVGRSVPPQQIAQAPTSAVRPFNAPVGRLAQPASKPAPNRTFSTTKHIANVQIRVVISGLKEPIVFSGVPVRQYTKLPNHRPPLRRDKPVRISLPGQAPKYNFPSAERSFIFIPRALRPNQQGFGSTKFRTGLGSIGGYSSRRTSVFGGSIYSPSVAMSRRSSMARDFGREGMMSPAGSVMSRPPGGFVDPNKPVVRLPAGQTQDGPRSGISPSSGTPVVHLPQGQTYPLPQKPTFRENWPATIPMHQPRPQKAVSVAGIESPASLTFQAPQQQEQQPFHQQVPIHMDGSSAAEPPSNYLHTRQPSYPSQVSGGTPLSNIPERAMHAQPFQPFQQAAFQPQAFAQPAYYYAAANGAQPQYPGIPQGAFVPMFVQNPPQGAYVVPAVTTTMAAPMPQPAPLQPAQQGNLVAHEANGMVYYYDPNASYQPNQMYQPNEGYQPASYTVPGMGGMMTPSPDGYYYPQIPPTGTVYYQQQ